MVRLPARQARVLETTMSQMQPSPKVARKGMIWASIAGVAIIAAAIVLMPKGYQPVKTRGKAVIKDSRSRFRSEARLMWCQQLKTMGN
jgi:hypothetical protein